jgi:hypothetical protein
MKLRSDCHTHTHTLTHTHAHMLKCCRGVLQARRRVCVTVQRELDVQEGVLGHAGACARFWAWAGILLTHVHVCHARLEAQRWEQPVHTYDPFLYHSNGECCQIAGPQTHTHKLLCACTCDCRHTATPTSASVLKRCPYPTRTPCSENAPFTRTT